MKLKQLFESESKALQLIKRDCGPWLKHVGKHLVYRGFVFRPRTKTSIEDVFLCQVRKDRRPKDSSKELHDLVNEYLFKHSGIHYRSEAVFVGALDMAQEYGSPFAIFPIGDFHYAWSKDIKDPWAENEDDTTQEQREENLAKLKKKLESRDDVYIYDKGIDEALRLNHEIMISCNSYYAIPISSVTFETLFNDTSDLDLRELTPKDAYEILLNEPDHKHKKELESIILKDSKYIVDYAVNVLKGRWIEQEKKIWNINSRDLKRYYKEFEGKF